jgi:hypothetical protein
MEEFYHRDILATIDQANLSIVSAVSQIAEAAQRNSSYLDSMRNLSQVLEAIRGARAEVDKELIRETGRNLTQLTNAETSDLAGTVNGAEQAKLILVEEGFNKLVDATREITGTVYREEFFRGFTSKITIAVSLTTQALTKIREMRASDLPHEQKLQFADEIIRAFTTVQTKGEQMFERQAEAVTNTSDLEDTMLLEAQALKASLDKLLQAVIDEASDLKTSISSSRVQQPLPKQSKRSRRPT